MSAPAAPAAPAPAAAPAAPVPSEDQIARKFDNCLADLLVNAGVGFGVGVVASVILFRRRGWPVALSTGFGAGVAYSNCNYSLNPYVLPGTKILPASKQ
ncbi:MICOS complex subunit MIC10 [Vanrija pseudolonga]|uniref:MICOS complex subunit MIC10 n=1 Tax=Vanrija pseudolonga TaxID=143232 RepID=A0AAF0XZI5_9TREE|nr:MICOS complex subunit MIC10 [Vanrija pseudolonga]